MNEADLAPPVMNWLHSRGLTPYGEVPTLGRAIDIIGIGENEEIEAVELKLGLTKTVINQAWRSSLWSDVAWCAVSTMPRRKLPDSVFSIGVVRVVGGNVEIIQEPKRRANPLMSRRREEIVRYCRGIEPFGVAGIPTMLGSGPAQQVFNAVQVYLAANPVASWKELFEKVPNHYKHWQSFRSSMNFVRDKRNRRKVQPCN